MSIIGPIFEGWAQFETEYKSAKTAIPGVLSLNLEKKGE